MDEETRAYLFTLGNPYAKLSVLDDVELEKVSVAAQPPLLKRRRSKDDANAAQAYLFKLENPYAKLSIVPQEEFAFAPAQPPESIDLLWKRRTEVYEYVGQAFALQFHSPIPALLKQFGGKVIRLSPRAQNALRDRIAAHLPDEQIVYNRLSPKELERLLAKLLEMADDALALDGQEE